MVRPERFELPASWFVARRSIQLSYGRALTIIDSNTWRRGRDCSQACACSSLADAQDRRQEGRGVDPLSPRDIPRVLHPVDRAGGEMRQAVEA